MSFVNTVVWLKHGDLTCNVKHHKNEYRDLERRPHDNGDDYITAHCVLGFKYLLKKFSSFLFSDSDVFWQFKSTCILVSYRPMLFSCHSAVCPCSSGSIWLHLSEAMMFTYTSDVGILLTVKVIYLDLFSFTSEPCFKQF